MQLVDLVPDSYIDRLDRHMVDLALLPRTEFPAWVDSRHAFDAPFTVIARRGHPRLARHGLAPGDTIPLDLFCELGHVLMSPEGKLSALGDKALAEAGRTRRVVMTMPFFSGVYRAVARSELIALIPRQLARQVCGPAGLALYAPPVPVPAAPIFMAWHRRCTADASHRWLRDQIGALLARLRE